MASYNKRRLDEGDVDDEASKRLKNFDEKEQSVQRILIDNHEAGAIIGKGGVKVNDIRTQSGCSINILPSDIQATKERVLNLVGSVEGKALALKLMVTYMLESQNSRKQSLAQDGEEFSPAESYTINLLIHQLLAGVIIGKGGARIKESQAQTGARIQLSKEPFPNSTEKKVSISGSPDCIYAAGLLVLTQLQDNPLRGGSSTINYTPGAAPMAYPPTAAYDPYGGAPAAYGAAPAAYGQGTNPYGGRAAPGAPGQGFEQGAYGAQPGYGQMYGAGFGGMPQGAPAAAGGAPPAAAGGAGQKTEKVAIPTVCVGAVIGKGGCKISEIKAQSATQISIAKQPEPTSPNDRIVTITGTAQGIQTAIYFIRQLVEAESR